MKNSIVTGAVAILSAIASHYMTVNAQARLALLNLRTSELITVHENLTLANEHWLDGPRCDESNTIDREARNRIIEFELERERIARRLRILAPNGYSAIRKRWYGRQNKGDPCTWIHHYDMWLRDVSRIVEGEVKKALDLETVGPTSNSEEGSANTRSSTRHPANHFRSGQPARSVHHVGDDGQGANRRGPFPSPS